MDIVGMYMGLWLVSWLLEDTPAPAPRHKPATPPAAASPEGRTSRIAWLKVYRRLAMARSDWAMSDYYGTEIDRLQEDHAASLAAYNQQVRDRLLKGQP